MVDSSIDPQVEFIRQFRKITGTDSFRLLNSVEVSLSLYLDANRGSEKREVLISALAPVYCLNLIQEKGFTPVILDVSVDSGYPETQEIVKKYNSQTMCYVNTHYFSYTPIDSDDLDDLSVLDIMLCGMVFDNEEIYLPQNSIISLSSGNLLSGMGGAMVLSNTLVIDYISQITSLDRDKLLSPLQVSLLNSQITDVKEFYKRVEGFYEIYTTAIMKSGYSTLIHDTPKGCGYFPVVVKKSLKDIQKYMKQQNLESFTPYAGSIIRQVKDVKASGSRSLSLRTFSIPLNMTIKKEHLELISRILSTLP